MKDTVTRSAKSSPLRIPLRFLFSSDNIHSPLRSSVLEARYIVPGAFSAVHSLINPLAPHFNFSEILGNTKNQAPASN
jgi:hypothetical protein